MSSYRHLYTMSSTTKERILDAAWRLLARDGAHATRMADVAREAGISRQAVYLHFKNRGLLLLALVDHTDQKEGLYDRIAEVRAIADPSDQLLASLSLTARYAGTVSPLALAIDLVRNVDEDAEAAWQDRMTHRKAGLRFMISRMSEAGQLSADWTIDDAVAALFVLGSPITYRQLVLELGWSDERYEAFLHDYARSVLFAPVTP
jgi:AcrR family transcriptional regulator